MRNKNLILISECISAPFDEGLKNVLYNIIFCLRDQHEIVVVTDIANDTAGLEVEKLKLNKMFVNRGLRTLLNKHKPDIILYVPEASCTFNSFLRAKVLKFLHGRSKIALIGVQHRDYSPVQSSIISLFLRPDLLMIMGKADLGIFQKKKIRVDVLPPAVDCKKFSPASGKEKEQLRADFNIPSDKTVVLHVGHIKVNRNIEYLIEVQLLDNIQVVIVGSTSISIEEDLKKRLMSKGIIVIDEYIPDISQIYRMSDVYVFPVKSDLEAIDMPLSVLEAMACNLPVITTRFGALVDNFSEDTGFRYFNRTEELMELVELFKNNMGKEKIHNNKKVEPYTWNRFTDAVISACNELV